MENLKEASKFVHDNPSSKMVNAYKNHDTSHLRDMHDRWVGDHTRNPKSNPETSDKLLAVHHVLKSRGETVGELPKHKNLGIYVHENTNKDNHMTGFNFGLSANLINTTRQIIERKIEDKKVKSNNTEVDINPETNDKIEEVSKSTLSSYVKKVASLPPEKVKPSREKGIGMASKKLRVENNENYELTDEDKARIAEIEAMVDSELSEVKHFKTSYGWAGGRNERTGDMHKHPESKSTKSKDSSDDYDHDAEKKDIKRIRALKVKEDVSEEVDDLNENGDHEEHEEPHHDNDRHLHPIQQLKKIANSVEGREVPFKHKDGKETNVNRHLARHMLSVYNMKRTSIDKDEFAGKLHASNESMRSEINKHLKSS